MNFLIGALLELTLMGLLLYTCYLLYGHWRREGTNTEKMLFVGALIILLIYLFLLIPYVTDAPFTGVIKEIRDYAYYFMGSTLMIILIYAFKQVEQNEKSLEKIIEIKSNQLIEAERLAHIGEDVVKTEQEIRNPLKLISQAAYVAEERKQLNAEMIHVIKDNVEKINQILADLRVKSGVK